MINLFINSFEHDNERRKAEIDYCFQRNEGNEFIDQIVIVNRNDRATYGDFFRIMSKYKDDVNIIANLDIYFDETIELSERIEKNQCFALTRWEDLGGKIINFNQRHGKPSPPHWSQDAWIFRGSINPVDFDYVVAVNKSKQRERIPFSLGIPGCDNKIAALLRQKGYKVSNPSLSIKAIHKHNTNNRSYPGFQILEGIKPHGLVYQETLKEQ